MRLPASRRTVCVLTALLTAFVVCPLAGDRGGRQLRRLDHRRRGGLPAGGGRGDRQARHTDPHPRRFGQVRKHLCSDLGDLRHPHPLNLCRGARVTGILDRMGKPTDQ
jgi:hypothetical protein